MRHVLSFVLHVTLVAVQPIHAQSDEPGRQALHRCPEEPGESRDPTGRYVITCRPADTGRPAHNLVLARRDGRLIRNLQLARHGVFAWAPSGKAVAITDARASNESTCWVILLNDVEKVIDLTDLIKDNAMKGWRGHWYCDVQKWAEPDRLVLNVSGHGDDSHAPFEAQYVYEIGKGLMSSRP